MLLAYGLLAPEDGFPEGFEEGEAAIDALVDVGLLNLADVDVSVGGSGTANAANLCLTAHPLVLETNAGTGARRRRNRRGVAGRRPRRAMDGRRYGYA
ncbi:hypothetical protein SALBM135S_01247 [Streptomyces alboniger]